MPQPVERGLVVNVREVVVGDVLIAAASTGAQTLSLNDVTDFQAPGQVRIDTTIYDVDEVDDDAGTIHLTVGLVGDAAEDTIVEVYPRVTNRIAVVLIDGYGDEADEGDGLEARVRHSLYPLLPLGGRDDDQREAVLLDDDPGAGWTVIDVLGQAPNWDDSLTQPQPCEDAWEQVETLTMDTRTTGQAMTTVLEADRRYRILVEGTWSNWDSTLEEGTPEADAMFPSHARAITEVGLDPDVIFAGHEVGGTYPRHNAKFQVDLGSGFAHVEATNGPFDTPQAGHIYEFILIGEGSAPEFRIDDTPLDDNYGNLEIVLFEDVSGTSDRYARCDHRHAASELIGDPGGTPDPHATSHEVGGSDLVDGLLDARARLNIRLDTVDIGARRTLHLHTGVGIDLNASEDTGNEEIDVTIALAAEEVGVRVRRSTNQSMPNNTFTGSEVSWETEVRDDGGFFDSGAPTRLTFPEAGWYVVVGQVRWAGNTTGDRYVDIRRNGSDILAADRRDTLSTTDAPRMHVCSVFYFAADDYVELRAWQDSGGSLNVESSNNDTWFAAAPLSKLAGGGGGSSDTAPATIYIATTGSDTTGDGTSGNPYATLAKALSILPDTFGISHTIDVADGTYAEAVDLTRFRCAPSMSLKIEGNATTPTNVLFTGSVSAAEMPPQGTTASYVARIQGSVVCELEGITLRGNGTTQNGLLVQSNARCIFDRSRVDTSSGSFSARGIRVQHYATLEFQGNCTIQNWTTGGVVAFYQSQLNFTVAGTLTITGPGTAGNGVHMISSSFLIFGSQPSGLNITITGVQIGFQMAFNSNFTHQGASATITIDNASKPSDSAGVQCTDHSNWSTPNAVVIDNFTDAFEANSISYVEATGSRTITNVDNTSDATQNSVIYLP